MLDWVTIYSLIFVSRKISIARPKPKIINTGSYKNYDFSIYRVFSTELTYSENSNELWNDGKQTFCRRLWCTQGN